MAKSKQTADNRAVNKVFFILSVLATIVFLIIGGLALWAHNFTKDMVRSELSAQKIYFPEKGSPALDPATYPDLQQYAGELVDTPEEAKAYANGYIGRHLDNIAGGKVYSEISTEARQNPDDQKLQAQRESLFQGETLRGILLTSGYGFGTMGQIAGIAAVVAFILAGGAALLAFVLRSRL